MEIGFGIKVDSLNEESSEFAEKFKTACLNSVFRFFWVFWIATPFIKSEKDLKESVSYLEDYCLKIIKERRKEDSYKKNSDLISEYLLLEQKGEGKYSDKTLRDLVLNFM